MSQMQGDYLDDLLGGGGQGDYLDGLLSSAPEPAREPIPVGVPTTESLNRKPAVYDPNYVPEPEPRNPIENPTQLFDALRTAVGEKGAGRNFVRSAYDSTVGAAVRGAMRGGASIAEAAGGNAPILRGAANIMADDADRNDTTASGQLGGMFGQAAPAAAAMIASRAPIGATASGVAQGLALGTMGLGSAESGMRQYEEHAAASGEPMSPGRQLAIGAAYAATEVLFEKVGIDAIGKQGQALADGVAKTILTGNTAALAQVLTALGVAGAVNAGEEGATQIAQNIIDRVVYDPERDLLAGVQESAFQGGAQGLLMGGAGAMAHGVARGIQGSERANRYKAATAERGQRESNRQFREMGGEINRVMRDANEINLRDRTPREQGETPGQTAVRNATAWGDSQDRLAAIEMRSQELAAQRERAASEAATLTTEPETAPVAPADTSEPGGVLTRDQIKSGGWEQSKYRDMTGRFDDVYGLVQDANASTSDNAEYAMTKAVNGQFGIVSRPRQIEVEEPAPVKEDTVAEPAVEAPKVAAPKPQVQFSSDDTPEQIRAKWEKHQKNRGANVTVQLMAENTGNDEVDQIVRSVKRRGGRAVVVRSSGTPRVQGISMPGGTVVIDMASRDPIRGIIGHETMHTLQSQAASDPSAAAILDDLHAAIGDDLVNAGEKAYAAKLAKLGLSYRDANAPRREGQATALQTIIDGPPASGRIIDKALHRVLVSRFQNRSENFAGTVKTLIARGMNRLGLLNKARRKNVLDAVDAWERYARNASGGVQLENESVADERHNDDVRSLARDYAAQAGIKYNSADGENVKWDSNNAMRIADAFQNMEDQPNDPEVRRAYRKLADETRQQYDFIIDRGYKIVPWAGPSNSQPYANSDEMRKDIRENKRIYYFKTLHGDQTGFGSGESGGSQHPLLEDAERVATDSAGKKYRQTYNDLFRAVHDFFGHAKEGHQFGPRGEENAWRVHSRMFTPEARRAMTTETRGQNSWVNAGKHLRDESGRLRQKGDQGFVAPPDRPFADQKAGLLDEEFSRADGVDESITETEAFKKWFGDYEHPKAWSSAYPPDRTPVSMAVEKGPDGKYRPRVFYHGSNADFRAFDKNAKGWNSWAFGKHPVQRAAFFFTPDATAANEYALQHGKKGASLRPVYLDAKYPLDLREGMTESIESDLKEAGVNTRWLHNLSQYWEAFDDEDGFDFVDKLKKAGWDSVIIKEAHHGTDEDSESWIVFNPHQIKSASGNSTFNPSSDNIDESIDSTDLRMDRRGVRSGDEFDTIQSLARFFDRRYLKKRGHRGNPSDAEDFRAAVTGLSREVKHQLKLPETGQDWYNKDIKEAYKTTAKAMPELVGSSPEAKTNRILMAAVAGAFSPSTRADANWYHALHAMRSYLDTGTFSDKHPDTGRQFSGYAQTRSGHLRFIEQLIEQHGDRGAARWLVGRHSIAELDQVRQESGLWGEGSRIERPDLEDMPEDGKLPGSYVLGPKVGAFVRNILGLPDVTVDIWNTRTFNRLFGRMIDGDSVASTPRAGERSTMKRLIREVAERVGVPEQDVQAIAWFYEQQLYTDLGVPSASTKFSQGAERYVQEREAGGLGQGVRRRSQAQQPAAAGLFDESVEEVEPEKIADLQTYGAWIAPDGKTYAVPPTRHWEVARDLSGKYGFNESDDSYHSSEDRWRIPALKAGMIRVVRMGGRLTFQADNITPQSRSAMMKMAKTAIDQGKPVLVDHISSGQTVMGGPDRPLSQTMAKLRTIGQSADESIAHPEELANKLISKTFGRGVAKPTARVLQNLAGKLAAGQKTGKVWDALRGATRRAGLEIMPDRLLLPEWVASRREAEMESRFGKAIGSAYGHLLHYGGRSGILGFDIDKKWIANPANRRLLNDVLLQDQPLSALPAAYRPVATKVRDELDKLGQDAVNAGYMTQETFDRNKGKYLPRLYEQNELDKLGLRGAVNRLRMNNERRKPRLSDAFAIVDRNGDPVDGPNGFRFGSALLRDQYLDHLIQTRTVDGVNRAIRGSGRHVTLADLSPAGLRKLPQPMRELVRNTRAEIAGGLVKNDPKSEADLDSMGLIREPSYPVATAMIQLHHDLAMLKFYKNMAANSNVASDTETSHFNKQVPNSPKFGDLAGMWLPEELHRDLQSLHQSPGLALELYRNVLSKWKYGKTVLNPATWGRNFLGNFMFADLAGVGPHDPRNWSAYADAVATLSGQKGGARLQELQRKGVIGTEFSVTELGNVLRELRLPSKSSSPLSWGWEALSKLNRKTAQGYNAIDTIFKVAAYEKQRAMGASSDEAAAHVQKWFPDYSRVPKTTLVKGLKDVVFPFLSFNYEAARIGARAIKEKPLTFAKWAAVPYLVTQASIAALGLSPEDEDEVKKELRGGGVFAMLMPFRDSKDRLIQWDLSNVVPIAGLTGLRSEASPMEDKTLAENVLGGLVTSNPFMALAVSLGTNKDPYTRAPITHTGMTGLEAANAIGSKVRNTLQPGVVSAIESNVRAGSVQKSTLDKRDRVTTATRSLAGVDLRSADPQIRRMVDSFIERKGLPLGSEFSGDTTPRQRAGRALYQALLNNDVGDYADALRELDALGVKMRTAAEIKASVESRHPLARIRKTDRPQFIRELTPEQRRVVRTATDEFERLLPRAYRLASQARSLPRD